MSVDPIQNNSVLLVSKLVRLTSEGVIHWRLSRDNAFLEKCKQGLGNGESLLGDVFAFGLDNYHLRLYKYGGFLGENNNPIQFYLKYRLEFYDEESLDSKGVIPPTNALADLYDAVVRSLSSGPVADFIQELDKVK